MNQTTASMMTQGGTNIKTKLAKLEEIIFELKGDMDYHKRLVDELNSQKINLESVVSMKTEDIRKNLTNLLFKVEDEMKKHFSHQKAENARLQQHIAAIKNEKTLVEQQLLGINRRISEMELQIGAEDQD